MGPPCCIPIGPCVVYMPGGGGSGGPPGPAVSCASASAGSKSANKQINLLVLMLVLLGEVIRRGINLGVADFVSQQGCGRERFWNAGLDVLLDRDHKLLVGVGLHNRGGWRGGAAA